MTLGKIIKKVWLIFCKTFSLLFPFLPPYPGPGPTHITWLLKELPQNTFLDSAFMNQVLILHYWQFSFILLCSLSTFKTWNSVLQPFKSWHVPSIQADRRIFMEPWRGLTYLYSSMGDPLILQAVCAPICLCVTHCMSPVPLYSTCMALVSQHGIQQWGPSPLNTRYTKTLQETKILYDISWYCACEPTQGYNTTYQAHSEGYEKLLPLVVQAWASKPDCIHLPYKQKNWIY